MIARDLALLSSFLLLACGDDAAGSGGATDSGSGGGGSTVGSETAGSSTGDDSTISGASDTAVTDSITGMPTTDVPTTDAPTTGAPPVCEPGAQVACDCPMGQVGVQVCAADGAGFEPCACPDDICGDGEVGSREVCDDGVNDGSYGHCLPGCVGPGPGCGDGEVNGPEACDDGNNVGDDDCNGDCVVPGTLLWTRNYTGEDAGNARARGAALDDSGNVIVVGEEFVVGQNANVWARKYTPEGEVLWTWTWNGASNGDDIAHAVAIDPAGDLVIVGETYVGGSGADMLFIKLGPDSKPVWQSTHNGPGNLGDRAFGVAVDGAGNIAVTGEEYKLIGLHNVWTRLMDTDGKAMWTDVHDANAGNDAGHAVAFTSGGDVIVAGSIYVPIGLADLWLRKYSSVGATLWTRSADHMLGNDIWRGVAVDGAGNIGLVGEVYEVMGLSAIKIARYDADGVELWSDIQDSAGGDNDIGRGVAFDMDNNLVAVGEEYTANDFARAWVRKYDAMGEVRWTQIFDGDAAGNDIARAVAIDPTGHVYAAGEEYVVGQFATVWLSKYAP